MAHLILYSDKNFAGDHEHVFDTTTALTLDVSSIVILSGSWQFYKAEAWGEPYDVILGPGLYRFVGSYKLENDNVHSVKLVDTAPTMPGEPVTAYLTLFEHASFRGEHRHVFEGQTDLGASMDFAGLASSLMVEQGQWSFFYDTEFDGSYLNDPVIGVGVYPSVADIGIGNDSIVSVTPTSSPSTISNAVDNHAVLFQELDFYGDHRHVVAPEPNLNADDDDDFNDSVRSLSILAGSWLFYSDALFSGQYRDHDGPLPVGLYRDVTAVGIGARELSSLQPTYEVPVTMGEPIVGEIILFTDFAFGGRHKHVLNGEDNLNSDEDDDFNDAVTSFVIIQGNWQFYRHAGFKDNYPAVLGPGLYPAVQDVKIRNNDVSSLQVVSVPANMPPPEPLTDHLVLFEHASFHGDHRHIFRQQGSLESLDAGTFDNMASSLVVLLGRWQTFAAEAFQVPFAPILAAGLYPSLPTGIGNDDISSVQPSMRDPTATGAPILGHVVLFEHGRLRGAHKHVFNSEIDLNAGDDDSFNDETSSLAVHPSEQWSVRWKLYRDSWYAGGFDVLLGAGRYPDLPPTHIANDELSSLRVDGAKYEFAGMVTVKIASGSFPDPITHDVVIGFVFLAATNSLVLETPFAPFPGPDVDDFGTTISLAGIGAGTLLPDGTCALLSAHIAIATSLTTLDIIFDLVTGSVMSPNNAFMDQGSPRDQLSGQIRMVGAGRENDDDYLVILEGTLNPNP